MGSGDTTPQADSPSSSAAGAVHFVQRSVLGQNEEVLAAAAAADAVSPRGDDGSGGQGDRQLREAQLASGVELLMDVAVDEERAVAAVGKGDPPVDGNDQEIELAVPLVIESGGQDDLERSASRTGTKRNT